MNLESITTFVEESNRIEGIDGIREGEIEATSVFLARDYPQVADLAALVKKLQPNAELRTRFGMDVQVGGHIPHPGGPGVELILVYILRSAQGDPFRVHQRYERLHPFTDGNGRSGRALWLWMMLNQGKDVRLGFLHTWYYQSLDDGKI